jgi:hypothetical protein
VRRPNATFEEIKFRAALARTQWESLQEKARNFQTVVQEAKERLATASEAKVKVLQSTNVDASLS